MQKNIKYPQVPGTTVRQLFAVIWKYNLTRKMNFLSIKKMAFSFVEEAVFFTGGQC